MKGALLYRGPAVLYAAGVLILSLMPDSGAPGLGWDKANHFMAYAAMSLLFMRAASSEGMPPAKAAIAAIIVASLFGIGVEFLQSLTSMRRADALDALANGLGAVLGAAVFRFIKNRAEVKRCL